MKWLVVIALPLITLSPVTPNMLDVVNWVWGSVEFADYVRSFTDQPWEKLIAVAIAVLWGMFCWLVLETLFGLKTLPWGTMLAFTYLPIVFVSLHYGFISFSDKESFHMTLLLAISWAMLFAMMRISVAKMLGIITTRQQ